VPSVRRDFNTADDTVFSFCSRRPAVPLSSCPAYFSLNLPTVLVPSSFFSDA
jgi:hypothetical protein